MQVQKCACHYIPSCRYMQISRFINKPAFRIEKAGLSFAISWLGAEKRTLSGISYITLSDAERRNPAHPVPKWFCHKE